MKTQGEDGHLQAKKRGLKETNPANILILDFQPLTLKANLYCLSCPVLGPFEWSS